MKSALFLILLLGVSIVPLSFAEPIVIQTDKEQFASGDIVSINGIVDGGNFGDFVALEIKSPSGETILIRTVTLGDEGTFDLKFKIPDSGESGSYEIVANTQQNEQTITKIKTIEKTSQIPSEDTSEEGGGCLIATATYGSELAPQVQQLREIRDNSLLTTTSGTQFMGTFNDVYYSFSPIIADYERENHIFKEIVKIAITPMVSSLSILNYVDMDSESSVLGYGISLIILNGLMYVGIPIAGIIVIRKRF